MNTKLSVLFFVKRTKTNVDGLLPIFIRVTVNGARIEFSTKRFTTSEKWSVEGNRMKGTSAESKATNSYLDTLKAKVYDYQQQLIREDELVNAENMRNKILGVEKRSHMLIGIFQQHNEEIKALVGREFATATYTRYETSLKHTIAFLNWKYKVSDIDIRKIDHEFVTSYEFYLKSVHKCNQNTTAKYIKNFGKIVRICLANGWIERDPFINYKCKIVEVDRAFLSQDEIETMFNKVLATDRLNQVKDIFLFSCFTGLAYVDVKKLSRKNIGFGVDGERWIFINRTKTDTRSNIPLLPIASSILKKYEDHPQVVNQEKLLPILSNQKMNSYLKEIADVCEINKELTFHIARHTFATTVTLSNGVPIESVSKMLGHKNLKTTQHYAKILDLKVSVDMRILKEKLAESTVLKKIVI
ncbi:MAG: recombinase [Bacteroidetes bacterium GWD2_45_23]|nr:MAG: recombinase [Bacteroidetes bacterium GWC2_46_850]OFX74562.1 MAG: recombinase [Bacteroidetes bacterium GWC1_47_7]OFX82703.1 MAG: recombinase [Bacteroidetes bacterium GWD2_45_23]HAR39392.1 recombinase [Porphyromonadaceae bacterium]HBB02009.1 recombinase [Porphyromonadaceae bacterium]